MVYNFEKNQNEINNKIILNSKSEILKNLTIQNNEIKAELNKSIKIQNEFNELKECMRKKLNLNQSIEVCLS